MRANLLSFQLIKSKLKPTWFSFRKLSRAFCRWHVFTLAIGCMVFCACYWLHFFPRLPSVPCFPAFAIGCMISGACHRLYVFSRLPSVACFPALAIGCRFSHVFHRLHVSSTCHRLPLVPCFPVLFTSFTCACYGWHKVASSSVWLNQLFATVVTSFVITFLCFFPRGLPAILTLFFSCPSDPWTSDIFPTAL